MKYDFDTVTDRRGTDSLKHDGYLNYKKSADLLPLWVADMDFKAPKEVADTLKKIAEYNIYGYTDPVGDHYFQAVSSWMKKHHGWDVKKEWLVKSPGIVFAISAAIRGLTKEGDAVLIQEPVYYPFRGMIEANNRRVVNNGLINKDGHYVIDFCDLENKLKNENVKLFILCSPHNPVGRVWTKEELLKAGELCEKYHVYVVDDEIHAEFTYPGYKHQVFSLVKESFGDFSIICTSPSKAFNLAGLQTSNLFIKNEDIRKKVKAAIAATGYDEINIFGLAACEAAYTYGEDWLAQVKEYLAGNLAFVREFLTEHTDKLKLVEPEGTYLIWIDCRGLGISDEELKRRIEADAKLWLDDGSMFGSAGEGFERINIACPRSVLTEAMTRLLKIIY